MLDAFTAFDFLKNAHFLASAIDRNDERDVPTHGFLKRVTKQVLCPAFQLVMTPSRFLLMMASSEESTIAASKPIALSALRRNPGNSSKINWLTLPQSASGSLRIQSAGASWDARSCLMSSSNAISGCTSVQIVCSSNER